MSFTPALPKIWNVISNKYDESRTYAIGSYCYYDGAFYKANVDITTAETWNPAHWTQTLVSNEFGSGGGSGAVKSVNGKTGDVVLASGDIKMADGTTTLEVGITGKIDKPATSIANGKIATADGTGNITWTDAPVTSINLKTGAVTLNAGDIKTVSGTKTVEEALDSKISLPTGVTTVGAVPKADGAGGIAWVAESVLSVNTKTGAVVLASGDIKMADGTTTLETAITGKIDKPATTIAAGKIATSDGAGNVTWSDAPVLSVNTKIGAVVLSAADIKMANTETLEDEVTRKHTELSGALSAISTALGLTMTETYNPTTKVYDYTFALNV